MKSKSHVKWSATAVVWTFSSSALFNLGFLDTIRARPGALLPNFKEPLLGADQISSDSTVFAHGAPTRLMSLGRNSDELRNSARYSSPGVLEPEGGIYVDWLPNVELENHADVEVSEGKIQRDNKKTASLWRSSTQRALQRVKVRLETVGKVAKKFLPSQISNHIGKGRIHAGWNPNMMVETAVDAGGYFTGFNAASFGEYIKKQCALVTQKTELHWLEILLHLTTNSEPRFTTGQWGTILYTLERPFHDSEILEGRNIAADIDASSPQVPGSLSQGVPKDDTHAISDPKLEASFHNSEIREGANIAADKEASKLQVPDSLSHQASKSASHDNTPAISEAKPENLEPDSNTVTLPEAERRRLQLLLGGIHTFILNHGEPLEGEPLKLDPILSDVINDLYNVIWYRNKKHPGISTLAEYFHTYLDMRLPFESRRVLKVQPTPYDR